MPQFSQKLLDIVFDSPKTQSFTPNIKNDPFYNR